MKNSLQNKTKICFELASLKNTDVRTRFILLTDGNRFKFFRVQLIAEHLLSLVVPTDFEFIVIAHF